MEFTHERLVPDNYNTHRQLYYWHISRYNYAKQFLRRDDSVLDVACGTGYGAYELAFIAKNVTAIDIDQATINYASKTFKSSNIKYICGNAVQVQSLTNEKFNVCTSFETIEHLTKEDQEQFLINIVSVLQNDGTFIVSTPNTSIYIGHENTTNEFHLHELTYAEFKSLLEKHFEVVFIVGQRRFEGAGHKDRMIKISGMLNSLRKLDFKSLKTNFSDSAQQATDFEFPTTEIEQCLIYLAICKNPRR